MPARSSAWTNRFRSRCRRTPCSGSATRRRSGRSSCQVRSTSCRSRSSGPTSAAARRRSRRSAPTHSTSARSPTSRRSSPPGPAPTSRSWRLEFRKDPVDHPIYQLGIAPGVDVKDVEDLRGKKIAYSPGQAQGALVLRVLKEAGLTKDDVELVELPSTGDAYVDALGSKQVDVAPLGGVLLKRYLAKYGKDGGTTIQHGLRDDPVDLYVPTTVARGRRQGGRAARVRRVLGARPGLDATSTPTSGSRATTSGDRGPHRGRRPVPGRQRPVSPTSRPLDRRDRATPGDHRPARPRSRTTRRLDVKDIYDLRYEHVAADAIKGGRGAVTAVVERSVPGRPRTRGPADVRPRRRRLGPGRAIPFGWLRRPRRCWSDVVRSARPPACSTSACSRRRGRSSTTGKRPDRRRPAAGEHPDVPAPRGPRACSSGPWPGVVARAVLSGLTRVGEALIDGPVQIKRAIPSLALHPAAHPLARASASR